MQTPPTTNDIENQRLLSVPEKHHRAISAALYDAISKAKSKEESEPLIFANAFFQTYTVAVEVQE